MTTYSIYIAPPAAGTASSSTGQAAKVDSGMRFDSTVQGATGILGSLLDGVIGSTTAIKLAKYLGHLQRFDGKGRAYYATSDAGATWIAALL